ncbi:hypothetical protein GCM10009594_08470 [Kocuria palustris]
MRWRQRDCWVPAAEPRLDPRAGTAAAHEECRSCHGDGAPGSTDDALTWDGAGVSDETASEPGSRTARTIGEPRLWSI